MDTPAQRERIATRALNAARDEMEAAARELLSSAPPIAVLFTRLRGAIAAADEARMLLHAAERGEILDPSPPHPFKPDASGYCLTCGKIQVAGHDPSKAPPVDPGVFSWRAEEPPTAASG